MYEHLRNELIAQLEGKFNLSELNIILDAIDKVVLNYDIKEKETSVIVYDNSFAKLANTYLSVKKFEGATDRTLILYRNRLRTFNNWINKNPEDITTNEIRGFLLAYGNRDANKLVSDVTMDKFRQIIDNFFKWLVDEEYIVKNPCRNIKAIKLEKKQQKVLDRVEIEELRRSITDKRDLAIFDVALSTGARVSEIANMRLSEFNTNDNSIHIIGKGRKHHTVYLNATALVSLNEYLQTRTDNSDWMFVNKRFNDTNIKAHTIEKQFRQLSEHTSIKVTPHCLRRTMATNGVNSGVPITTMQKMLNHANINTTMIYTRVSQQEVKSAHAKYIV